MQISAKSLYSPFSAGISRATLPGYAAETAVARPVTTAAASGETTVSISSAGRLLAARDAAAAQVAGSGKGVAMQTQLGEMPVDLDAYFSPGFVAANAGKDLPILLPNQQNLQALSDHLAQTFPRALQAHGIPQAPASISYDRDGQIQLPADYPYAEQLKAALDREPALDRELRTLNSLTEYVGEGVKAAPFERELAGVKTQSELEALVNKYRYLFDQNRNWAQASLSFDANGRPTPLADGKSVLPA